jgi:hypothetical protein
MIDKVISIIIGLIIGFIIYKQFLMKTTIILNYNFDLEETDKIRINNKCFKSN